MVQDVLARRLGFLTLDPPNPADTFIMSQKTRDPCLKQSMINLFIYQARESSLVPAGFLTAEFLQKKVIFEAFVLMGKLVWCFFSLLSRSKENL